jgi:hypothetical protein
MVSGNLPDELETPGPENQVFCIKIKWAVFTMQSEKSARQYG